MIQPLYLIIRQLTSANSGQWTKTTRRSLKKTPIFFLSDNFPKPRPYIQKAESWNIGQLKYGYVMPPVAERVPLTYKILHFQCRRWIYSKSFQSQGAHSQTSM